MSSVCGGSEAPTRKIATEIWIAGAANKARVNNLGTVPNSGDCGPASFEATTLADSDQESTSLWIDCKFGPHAGTIVTCHVADKQIFSSLQINGQRT